MVGLRAPSFSVPLLDGRPITDAEFRAERQPYILFFYASW
jgi:hypothetical protein